MNDDLRLPERALHYAQLCLRQCADNQIGDFDLAFAYEAVARALACAGEAAGVQEYYRLAEEAGGGSPTKMTASTSRKN